MPGAPPAMQLLTRFEIVAPGHLRARGGSLRYGVIFMAAGLGILALPVSWLRAGRWEDPFWVAVVFGGIFTLAGFWIAGLRERLDVTGSEIRDVLLTWSSRKERRVDRGTLAAVRLQVRVWRSSRRRRSTRYVAALVIRDPAFPHPLQLTARRTETAARRDAEKIARVLAVRFEDALGDEILAVAPGDLDSERPAPAESSKPVPKKARVEWTADGPELVIRGILRPSAVAAAIGAGVWMGAGALLMTAIAGFVTEGEGPVPLFMAAILGLPGFFFVAWGVYAGMAEEEVRLRGRHVERQRRFLGLRGPTRRLARDEIESLRVQTHSAAGYGLVLVTDRRRLLVGGGLDADGLEWLRAWLVARL